MAKKIKNVANLRKLIQLFGSAKNARKALETGGEAVKGTFNFIFTWVGKGWDKYLEVNHAVSVTSREMGLTLNQLKGQQENIISNYGRMANRLGMTFDEIAKFQTQYTDNVGRSIVLTNQQVESLASLSKFMGEGAVSEMAANMDDFAASSSSAVDYLTLNMARAANQGLNIKKTGEAFAKNIKMASRYTFKEGVNSISKMTMLSQRLKFNMESIGNIIDKFSTIEGAISTSANLQMLGGSYAATFANPMVAMSEALLDAEGFTERIVKSVSNTAIFNQKTGMVDMSALDKAKMKEAANQLGIDYNELWNMASQQAKISNIEKSVRGNNFTEEQMTFLANTAQYDAQRKVWQVSKLDEKGNQQMVDIQALTSEQLKEIQKNNNFEDAVKGDVHAIRSQLDEYLKNETKSTKSRKEAITGAHEFMKFGVAKPFQAMDGIFAGLQNFVHELKSTIPLFAAIALGGSAKFIGAKLIGKAGSNLLGSKLIGKLLGGIIANGGIKAMLPVAGGAVASIASLGTVITQSVQASKINKEYKAQVNEVRNNTSLTEEEKRQQLLEITKQKKKENGQAVGAAIGANLGVGLGALLGPIGMAVGATVGTQLGKWIGGAVNSRDKAVDKKLNKELGVSSVSNTSNNTTNIAQSTAMTKNTVSSMSQRGNDVLANNINNNAVHTEIKQKPISEKSTYIRSENTSVKVDSIEKPSIDKLKVDISGTLKVASDGGKQVDLDMAKVFDSPQFKTLFRDAVAESFSRNISPTQTRNLNSFQSRTGGQWTINSANGKA